MHGPGPEFPQPSNGVRLYGSARPAVRRVGRVRSPRCRMSTVRLCVTYATASGTLPQTVEVWWEDVDPTAIGAQLDDTITHLLTAPVVSANMLTGPPDGAPMTLSQPLRKWRE